MQVDQTLLLESILRAHALSHPTTEHYAVAPTAELLAAQQQIITPPELEQLTARAAETLTATEQLHALPRDDQDFPQALRRFAPEIPLLFVYGNTDALLALERRRPVAVTGARRATAYGREVAYSLGTALAAAGTTVIAGMALGIEGAAQRGALHSDTATIAVLANSPDHAYPRSHRLLHEQICENGCAISVTPPHIDAGAAHFRYRSALIGALADATVLVEASDPSKPRPTIDAATATHKPVFAVPGPITSSMSDAPNDLIAKGAARLLRSPHDLINEFTSQGPLLGLNGQPLTPPDREVLAEIRTASQQIPQLARTLPHLSPQQICTSVGALELAGLITRNPRGALAAHS